MIEQIERFGAKFERLAFLHDESPMQRGIHHGVAGPGQNVAAGVTEGVRRRRRKCIDVEEMIGIALAARQDSRDCPRTTLGRLGVPELAKSVAK